MIVEDNRSSRSWFDIIPGESVPMSPDATILRTQSTELSTSIEGLGEICESGRLSPSSTLHSAQSSFETTSSTTQNPTRSAREKCCCSEHNSGGLETEYASQNPSERSALSNWYTKWFRDWWALEVGSIVLGTCCIIFIAMMLHMVDGQEMVKWKLGISLDALLSLLSGFTKSCLLMPTAEALGQLRWPFDAQDKKRAIDIERIDKASRGTWGSVVLLVRARGV
jgi:hypothetical protein